MGAREAGFQGRRIRIEWGAIAGQANGAALVRGGDTVVLATVVASDAPPAGLDFFPLTVDYRERFSASGRFPGGYRKREGQPGNHEILASRLIDRSIRPLFPEWYRCETQVQVTVLAFDPDLEPEILGVLGASAALTLSDIPWDGPVAAVRIGRSPDREPIASPSSGDRTRSDIDLVATCHREGLVMIEAGAREATEEEVSTLLEWGHAEALPLLDLLGGLRQEGRRKRDALDAGQDLSLADRVAVLAQDGIDRAVRLRGKSERREALGQARSEAVAAISGESADGAAAILASFDRLVHRAVRRLILDEGLRPDGRRPEEIRSIEAVVPLLPRVHGSALFTRGETQALVVCTLGTGQDEQEVERLSGIERDRFQLHYRFPPYSVGEVRPIRGPGRREIGHGALARRALEPVLPDPDRFPYTIKIESEITSSNGSSSMATVCGGSLALMDAAVPVRGPVAGIAMGLIREGERFAVLSDIVGEEDHLGDMDFKVAGTGEGVTAIQLDNKIGALPIRLLLPALEQARAGRLHVLAEMAKSIARPREDLPPQAPRVGRMLIPVHRIRDLIGPGGRMIQAVQLDTGSRVEVADDGAVRIYAPDRPSLEAAMRRVRRLTGEPEVGRFYRGTVTGVKDFGLFVRLFEGIEGLVHASELADGHVADPGALAAPGDEMVVKVLGVDAQGKIKLSRRQALRVPAEEIASD